VYLPPGRYFRHRGVVLDSGASFLLIIKEQAMSLPGDEIYWGVDKKNKTP
jgi:hypothetical protein